MVQIVLYLRYSKYTSVNVALAIPPVLKELSGFLFARTLAGYVWKTNDLEGISAALGEGGRSRTLIGGTSYEGGASF